MTTFSRLGRSYAVDDLRLENFVESHIPLWERHLLSDPKVMRQVYSYKTGLKKIPFYLEHRQLHGFGWSSLFAGDRFIGRVGIFWNEFAPCEAELGYTLRREAWGQGLATRGSALALRDFFAAGAADQVVALIEDGNGASLGVARKLGFERNAVPPVKIAGNPTPMGVHALTCRRFGERFPECREATRSPTLAEIKDRGGFSYRLVTAADLARLDQWFRRPHLSSWIHGEGLRSTQEGLAVATRGDTPDSANPYWLAFDGGEAVALLIAQEASDAQRDLAGIPGQKAVGLDVFIAHERYRGVGLTPFLIGEFLLSTFPAAEGFVIDPEATNARAIKCYERLGFRRRAEFVAPWHPVAHLMMHVSRTELAQRHGAPERK